MPADEDKQPVKKNYVGFIYAFIIAAIIASLFHLLIGPNTYEYNILISAIFTFIVFIASSYYSIRTMDKQSMIDAESQTRLSNNKIWSKLSDTWCSHYTKDTFCFLFSFFSSMLLLLTLFFSFFYIVFFGINIAFVLAYFTSTFSFFIFFIVIFVRLGWIKFEDIKPWFEKNIASKNGIDCEKILKNFLCGDEAEKANNP